MKRPTKRAIILAYLALTATITPAAYRVGYAKSVNQATATQNGTVSGKDAISPFARLTGRNGCALLGQPGTIRHSGIEIDCLPSSDARPSPSADRKVVAGLAQNRRRTPLDAAFTSTIAANATDSPAGGSKNDGQISSPPNGAALAPDINAQENGRLGGPTAPSNSGLPYNIFAPVLASAEDSPPNSPDAPPENSIPAAFNQPETNEMPDLVTPIPAALPLLLTGIAGLMTATRRKRCKFAPSRAHLR